MNASMLAVLPYVNAIFPDTVSIHSNLPRAVRRYDPILFPVQETPQLLYRGASLIPGTK